MLEIENNALFCMYIQVVIASILRSVLERLSDAYNFAMARYHFAVHLFMAVSVKDFLLLVYSYCI